MYISSISCTFHFSQVLHIILIQDLKTYLFQLCGNIQHWLYTEPPDFDQQVNVLILAFIANHLQKQNYNNQMSHTLT